MFSEEEIVLLIIDFQEKLIRAMHDKENLINNTVKLIKGAKILGIPILWTEQNPENLGPTIPEISELLTDIEPIKKLSFSCCGEDEFNRALEELEKDEALVTGIESHVCVYQTAMDLLELGMEAHIVTDAVSSRNPSDKNVALQRCSGYGASVTTVEIALFEALKTAENEKFKEILQVIK